MMMEHCNGCNQEVEDPIKLDNHCSLPYCKNCITELEKSHEEGYQKMFENPDGRKCDRCEHQVYKYYLVTHVGNAGNYDCTFCKLCMDNLKEIIQDLKDR